MNKLWDISIKAIKKDKKSLYDLHLMASKDAAADGQLYLVLKELCAKSTINGKRVDANVLDDVYYEVFEVFKNEPLKLDANIYGLLYKILISKVSDFYKIANRNITGFAMENATNQSENESIFCELLIKDWLSKIGSENIQNVQKSIEYFNDLHPLKALLYINQKNTLLEENVMIDVIRAYSRPIIFGYFNEKASTSFYNLRHNLLSNFNHKERVFMKTAIEEMLKSVSENRPGNPDPMVGACVVDASSKIIGKCFRGERRPAEHCEFILFDEKLKGVDVSRCTLYVTLEPCSKRGSTKTGIKKYPCAEHIINSGIKKVCIGMLDPDKKIFENGYQKLMEAGIEVWFFHSDLTNEIMMAEGNKRFIEHRSKSTI